MVSSRLSRSSHQIVNQAGVSTKKKNKLQLHLDSSITSFSNTIAKVKEMSSTVCAGDQQIRKEIEESAIRCEQERVKLLNLDDQLRKNRAETAFLLSRKTDSSRMIDTANSFVHKIKLSNKERMDSIAGTQALDQESERNRRRFAASSRNLTRRMKLANERAELLEATSADPQIGKKLVFEEVISTYQKSNDFKEVTLRIENKINDAFKYVPSHQRTKRTTGHSTYSLKDSPLKSPNGRNKLLPIRIENEQQVISKQQKTNSKISASHWKRVESSLRQIGNGKTTIDRFHVMSIEGIKDQISKPRSESRQKRITSHNLLMSPSAKPIINRADESTLAITNQISIFSPPSKVKARSGWDKPSSIDKSRMDQLSLHVPRDLKQTTLSDASRETLANFGTTPEKLRATIDIKKNETKSLSSPKGGVQSKEKQSKRSSGSVAAFPPLSTKAPTNPFSASKKGGTVNSVSSEKKSAQKSSAAPLPPMPKQAAKNPFSKDSTPKQFSTSVESNAAAAKASPFAPKAMASPKGNSSPTTAFGNMKGLGDSLVLSGSTDAKQNPSFGSSKPTQSTNSSDSGKEKDYTAILTSFYQKHNPSKLGEVGKTLEKYKGREPAMFEKLARKYKVPDPLQEASNMSSMPSTRPSSSSASEFGKVGSSPLPSAQSSGFGNTGTEIGTSPFASSSSTSMQQKTNVTPSPFGNSTKGPPPLGTSAGDTKTSTSNMFQSSTQSPFASSTSQIGSTPFGSPAQAQSPFGKAAPNSSSSPFGTTGGLSSTSPFGGTVAPTPFGAPSQSPMQPASQRLFNGKTARDLLQQFYQEKNPSKVAEVDKLLNKYKGNEEQMFRNLAKKYQLNPSVFGISPTAPAPPSGFGSSTATPAFGQQSMMGSPSPFGQSSGGFGQAPSFGAMSASKASGQTFGSGTTPGFGASGGFGSLAQSSPSPFGGQSFGAPSPAFGSPTPFGAPRR